MNIYDCFSPTILIIYRYFQFSASGSTTERRAAPGVLKRMHNNVASRLCLAGAGPRLAVPGGHWDAEPRRSAGAPGATVPQAASLAPAALGRPWRSAAAAFEAAACCCCCCCSPPAGAAGPSAGRGGRAAAGPAPAEGSAAAPRTAPARAAAPFDPNAVLQLERCVPLLSGVLFGLGS